MEKDLEFIGVALDANRLNFHLHAFRINLTIENDNEVICKKLDMESLIIMRDLYLNITGIDTPVFCYGTKEIIKEITFSQAKIIMAEIKLCCNYNKFINSPYYVTKQMLMDYLQFSGADYKDKKHILEVCNYDYNELYDLFIFFINILYILNDKNIFIMMSEKEDK